MKLGGLQKHTLIDYPGHIACTVFTIGCNFRCPYCHNPELVLPSIYKNRPDQNSKPGFLCFLETRKGLLDGVVITGGEPTIQPDLLEFCHDIKHMGFKIKLDTNGTNPMVLESLFQDHLIDYCAMDIKSNLSNYSIAAGAEADIENIIRSIDLIMNQACQAKLNYEFRTTCIKPFIDQSIIKDIGKMIQGAEKYILQPCNPDVDALNPEFLKKQDSFFVKKELFYLKEVVDKYVTECELR